MKTAFILFSIFSFTFFASGQELQILRLQDTAAAKSLNFNSEYLSGTRSLSLPLSLRIIPDSDPYYPDLKSILSLQSGSWKMQPNFDLSSIWKRETAKQEEYKTLRTIMQSIQAGGAAYLAYLHFKKYGFK